MKRIPLLILSDSPSCTSGLGRITRDLATRIHENLGDTFRVATLGYGAPGSSKLPFQQYHIGDIKDWVVPELPEVWEDFARGEQGIVLTIWDSTRLTWLSNPEMCLNPQLKEWLLSKPFQLWGYFPLDAEGPNDKLSILYAKSLQGFDRLLMYTDWAAKVVERTFDITGVDHLPHGIDAVFNPKPKAEARQRFRDMGFDGLTDDSLLVGIVATNQPRKDWIIGIQTVKLLVDAGYDVRLWIHTDAATKYWDLLALIHDYGLQGKGIITQNKFTDEQMSWMYSACSVTLGIGPEGFGFPLAESLACGVPVVHGNYAGGAEFVPKDLLVDPIAWRYEGLYACKRPVFMAEDWARKIIQVLGNPTELPEELRWDNLWPKWDEWLTRGIR